MKRMKRIILIIASVALLTPLTFAQDCPTQQFLDLSDYPMLDPNMVVTDPESGQKALLRVFECRTNIEYQVDGQACDPDGDDFRLYWDGTLMGRDAYGYWQRTMSFDDPNIYYHHLTATELPPVVPQKTRMGTYAFVVTGNTAPSLCGGTVTAMSDMRARQRLLMARYKATADPSVLYPDRKALVLAKED